MHVHVWYVHTPNVWVDASGQWLLLECAEVIKSTVKQRDSLKSQWVKLQWHLFPLSCKLIYANQPRNCSSHQWTVKYKGILNWSTRLLKTISMCPHNYHCPSGTQQRSMTLVVDSFFKRTTPFAFEHAASYRECDRARSDKLQGISVEYNTVIILEKVTIIFFTVSQWSIRLSRSGPNDRERLRSVGHSPMAWHVRPGQLNPTADA